MQLSFLVSSLRNPVTCTPLLPKPAFIEVCRKFPLYFQTALTRCSSGAEFQRETEVKGMKIKPLSHCRRCQCLICTTNKKDEKEEVYVPYLLPSSAPHKNNVSNT